MAPGPELRTGKALTQRWSGGRDADPGFSEPTRVAGLAAAIGAQTRLARTRPVGEAS